MARRQNQSMPNISGKTTVVGLIGWPVGHSISPAMHNAAFADLGLDWCYVPLPVAPDQVAAAVVGVRALGLAGANVTVPHKQAVIPHLDRLTPAAEAIGAVNTLIVTGDGQIVGDNTDAPGFIADLRAHGVDPAGMQVLVLGAGGSARAVIFGLLEAGVAAVTLANRSQDRAHALCTDYQQRFPAVPLHVTDLPPTPEVAQVADLIVNCTSLGMTPNHDTLPWDPAHPMRTGQVVYDLVYNPAQTRLLELAQRHGAQAIGGIGMLIYQGAIAFERWTGRPAPVAVMRAATGK